MKKIELNKQEKELVEDVIFHWREQGLLDNERAQLLSDNINEKSFEWKVLTRYAFWVALASLIFAIISLFADDTLRRFVEGFYDTPNIVFCVGFLILAVLFYFLGFRNKQNSPDNKFTSETLMLAGAFSMATCIGFLGKIIDRETHYFTVLFFLSILIYGVLAVKLGSKLLWIFMLIALGIWFATETALLSNWGWKFLGMNFPLRFTIFGIVLTAVAVYGQPKIKLLQPFESTSFVIGLLYTMIALWVLSIFGNYSSFDDWSLVRQYEILYWGILALLLSLGLAIFGLKKKDVAARDIGFVFFLLNLYTRFVEYLWDNINRAIFFLLLAISFWLVGRWSEKIWKKKSAS
ncbi:DUF2157 domain-containing protein [Sphingobacterium rhinopitheci]|uniref:DUF2157 domain-containing protein n=1 Tax=Sphingobacterium rhinopitheci TaxID=2781960 RepID=UPI001F523616|nr:DUF2157 domain-containing protein [Sphingobacterium rhinopitheci]MCI0920849.1 DUF2157 domain-containing protein [Sphingobacterium rhinopitheci]